MEQDSKTAPGLPVKAAQVAMRRSRAIRAARLRAVLAAAPLLALAGCGHPKTFEEAPRPVKVEVAEMRSAVRGPRYSAHIDARG